MCNAFNTARKPDKINLPADDKVILIRRTDESPILLPSGEWTTMKWGFQRPKLGVINNTRSDNLGSPMWKEAIEKRRCLIPVASYFEWTGPKGHKQTHRFRGAQNDWLWTAGIWEDPAGHGPCFSMLTTEANSLVSPIHHRMPAILTTEEQSRYLADGLDSFSPAPEMLVTEPSANPLIKKPPGPEQGELFS